MIGGVSERGFTHWENDYTIRQESRAAKSGEVDLLMAILENAITDLSSPIEEERIEAEEWFKDDDWTFIYSSNNIHLLLDLDKDAMWERLCSISLEEKKAVAKQMPRRANGQRSRIGGDPIQDKKRKWGETYD